MYSGSDIRTNEIQDGLNVDVELVSETFCVCHTIESWTRDIRYAILERVQTPTWYSPDFCGLIAVFRRNTGDRHYTDRQENLVDLRIRDIPSMRYTHDDSWDTGPLPQEAVECVWSTLAS